MRTFLRKWGIIASFAGFSLMPVRAQQANTQTGLETPWDARKIVTNVVAADEQLKPILGAMDPKEWYEKKGAPSTYVIQWQTAQRQTRRRRGDGKATVAAAGEPFVGA